MSDDIIIGGSQMQTVEERLKWYNEERAVLDKKYGLVLMADAYIDTDGRVRARPTVLPVEQVPKPEEVPADHVHDATTGEKIPVVDVEAVEVKKKK